MTNGGLPVPSSAEERQLLDPQKARVLQELEKQGYAIEPTSAPSLGGTICRHPVAPALLVCDDGRLELLNVKPNPQMIQSQRPLSGIRWRRGMLFLTLLGAATFLGLLVVAMILG
jgi:hypothetical protein